MVLMRPSSSASNHSSTSNGRSLAGRLKQKVFGGSQENASARGSVGKEPHKEEEEGQHVIAIEAIRFCKELGRGEFGCVYQAAWLKPGDEVIQVAVKRVLPERLIANPVSFLQEAAIMTRMRHKNVIRLYGVVLDTKAVMLVSELAPCGSLLECLQAPAWREALTISVLCSFALQIAEGMRYLEEQRLIHRDLAARNVLVSTPTKVKISDFGLSRTLGVGEDYYRSEFNSSMKLPIAWCAPESINFLRFTSASDVWAFGVTLYEMFSYGAMPWAGCTGAEILDAIDRQQRGLERPRACPSEFYALMCDCWNHDADTRPSFAQIVTRLPNIMPQTLRAIADRRADPNPNSQSLTYSKRDIITVIDRRSDTKSGSNNQLWLGALKSGAVGLFKPEETVAILDAAAPTGATHALTSLISSSTALPTKKGDHPNATVTSTHLLKSEANRERKKLLISQPQGDLRHLSGGSGGGSANDEAMAAAAAVMDTSVHLNDPANSMTTSLVVDASCSAPPRPARRHSNATSSVADSPRSEISPIPTATANATFPPPMRITAKEMMLPAPALPPRALPPKIRMRTSHGNVGSFPVEHSDRLVLFNGGGCGAEADGEESTFGSLPASTCNNLLLTTAILEHPPLEEGMGELLCCDSARDISDFSISTATTTTTTDDRRPLLSNQQRPSKSPDVEESVVRPMSPNEVERWKREVKKEHKKVAKKLERGATIEGPKPFPTTSQLEEKPTRPETLTAKIIASPPAWTGEVNAAYQLVKQCGHSLKDAPSLINSPSSGGGGSWNKRTPNATPATTPSAEDSTLNIVDPKQSIEYINDKLVGFADPSLSSTSKCKKTPPVVPPKPSTTKQNGEIMPTHYKQTG